MVLENTIATATSIINSNNTVKSHARGMTKAERIASAARNFKFDEQFIVKATELIRSGFKKYADVEVPADIAKAQDKIVKKLGSKSDLIVAKVGVSVYAYGNTFKHMEELKAAGLHLAYNYELRPYIWTPRKAAAAAVKPTKNNREWAIAKSMLGIA